MTPKFDIYKPVRVKQINVRNYFKGIWNTMYQAKFNRNNELYLNPIEFR